LPWKHSYSSINTIKARLAARAPLPAVRFFEFKPQVLALAWSSDLRFNPFSITFNNRCISGDVHLSIHKEIEIVRTPLHPQN
jgi:hypothetical protein